MKNRILRYVLCILTITIALNMQKSAFAAKKIDGLTATSSSFYNPNYMASRAVDGSPGTFWVGAWRSAPYWLVVDTGRVMKLEKMLFSWYYLYYATNFDIQTSVDGQTWEDVQTGLTGGYSGSVYKMIPYVLNTQARYVRIYMHDINQYFPIITEIEIYSGTDMPRKIRFQGILKDASGADIDEPLGLNLTFRIYNVAAGGTALWSEAQEDVVIEGGMLDVVLGSVNKIDLPFDESYFLGIEVETDGEMSPRFEMSSVPYAMAVDEQ